MPPTDRSTRRWILLPLLTLTALAGAATAAPLGLEVRQTAFALDEPGALDRTMFLDFEIHNKGTNVLEDAYVSFWFDPDLDGAVDDFVGCDTTLSLGYCYNAADIAPVYGAHPPAVGCKVLRGVVVGDDTLGMTSFNKFVNGTDPGTAAESYNYMQGLEADGSPQTCMGEATRFVLSGDPIAGNRDPTGHGMVPTTNHGRAGGYNGPARLCACRKGMVDPVYWETRCHLLVDRA